MAMYNIIRAAIKFNCCWLFLGGPRNGGTDWSFGVQASCRVRHL